MPEIESATTGELKIYFSDGSIIYFTNLNEYDAQKIQSALIHGTWESHGINDEGDRWRETINGAFVRKTKWKAGT